MCCGLCPRTDSLALSRNSTWFAKPWKTKSLGRRRRSTSNATNVGSKDLRSWDFRRVLCKIFMVISTGERNRSNSPDGKNSHKAIIMIRALQCIRQGHYGLEF